MRILIVSPYLPHREVGHGGGTATYQMTAELARSHELTLLCFQRAGEAGRERDLESRGVRVETISFRSAEDRGLARIPLILDRLGRVVQATVEDRPLRSIRYRSAAMRRRLEELIRELRPHAIQIEYFAMAAYGRQAAELLEREPALWENVAGSGPRRPRVLLNTHEAESLMRRRRLDRARHPLERAVRTVQLRRARRHEREAVQWADAVLCVSEPDRLELQRLTAAENLITMPLGIDTRELPELRRPNSPSPRLLFVGSFGHTPNVEAAHLLVEEIVPALRKRHPDLVLDIVGRRPPAAIVRAAAESQGAVLTHGFVEDLHPFFEAAHLFVAPLFSGGGIKIKILEALARGRAVLTTPIGLDGIDAELGRDVLSAASPAEFVSTADQFLQAPDELEALGNNGRDLIHRRYSWAVIAERLSAIMETDSRRKEA